METRTLNTSSGTELTYYVWLPEQAPTATLQIAHGMGEHAQRYDWFANQLTARGFAVYAGDHRGHGATRIGAPSMQLGDMGPGGWDATIKDMHELHQLVSQTHDALPHVLMGHSMGSMLTQQYLYRHPDGLSAAIISGSPGFGAWFPVWLLHTIARFESWRHGHDGESALLDKMLFGNSNENFDSDTATGFEWLSRDPDEVQKYVDDPLCGFVLRAGSVAEMLSGSREAKRSKSVARLPQLLPIHIFSGSADPVHDEEKNLQRMLKAYRGVCSNVSYQIYPDGRHEMLNETNRQQVADDLIGWLASVLD